MPYMQKNLVLAVLLITALLFLLVGVLYRIVKNNNEEYNKIVLSQRQQKYDSRVIPYRRGDIVDRNGTYIAQSQKVYNLIIDPGQIMYDEANYLEPTVQALVTSFGFDGDELRSLIREKKDTAYQRYQPGRRLSYDQKAAFEKLAKETNESYKSSEDESQQNKRVRGIWFEEEYMRYYPYGSMGCNVIGFASGDGSGGTGGIEQYYNDELTGINGREYGYLDEEANLEGVIKPARNGNTVVSTIDVNVQNIVQKYLDEWQSTTGSRIAAAIVMNPQNGEILAMGSTNTFDLNQPREVAGYYSDEEIFAMGKTEAVAVYKRENDGKEITEDQVLDYYSRDDVMSYGTQVAWNTIWRNFCVSDTYEPGSPSKVFTVAAGLEEGAITGNETFECGGYLQVADWKIKCVARSGHGLLTVQESLMQSCNVAMMHIAQMTGAEKFSKYQALFGFGDKTGIDLPGEPDTSGLIYSAEDMGPTELATNAFGQTYNCTMVQMAAAFSSVINGGSYYEPHVVKEILNEEGAVVERKEPVLVRETVSKSTSDFLKEAMFRTVEEGTGSAAAVAGYQVGGKTGTAEKLPRSAKNYLVSFAGFAPIDDPQVFTYVVIDTPNFPPGPEQAHSSYASAIFSKIMTEALPYLNVFPEEEPESEEGEASLPEEEGIHSEEEAGQETQETEPETEAHKPFATDEYIEGDDGGDSGLPEWEPEGESTSAAYPTAYNAPDASGEETEPETKAEIGEETEPESQSSPESRTEGETETEAGE